MNRIIGETLKCAARRLFRKRDIGANAYVAPGTRMNRFVSIGEGTRINGPANLVGCKDAPVSIGRFCAVGNNLTVRARNHHLGFANVQDELQRQLSAPDLSAPKGPVCVGHNVWIGDNVTVLSGVRVGNGAVIGAGAVVTKSVEDFQIVAGVPAKEIGFRFEEDVRRFLNETAWWNWSAERMKRNRLFFSTDFSESVDLDAMRSKITD